MIKWKFLNCICIFAAAIFILWVGCNEQPVDTEKADGSDSIASIEAPSNSQATLEEPTTESIVTESSVVESEYILLQRDKDIWAFMFKAPKRLMF